jgi:hypothetical protein
MGMPRGNGKWQQVLWAAHSALCFAQRQVGAVIDLVQQVVADFAVWAAMVRT